MQVSWQIEIKSVEAEFWKLFSSVNPLQIMVRLPGTAVGSLRLPDHDAVYDINFDAKAWVNNYDDEDSENLRIGSFRVTEVPQLVLTAITALPPQQRPPRTAFQVAVLSEQVLEALGEHMICRFLGRPLADLLPDFDMDQWLTQHSSSHTTNPFLEQEEDDRDDWWKRGDPPPE